MLFYPASPLLVRLYCALNASSMLQETMAGLLCQPPSCHVCGGTGAGAICSAGNINLGSSCQPRFIFLTLWSCGQGGRHRARTTDAEALPFCCKGIFQLLGALPLWSLQTWARGLAMLQLTSEWSLGGGSRQSGWCGMDVSELGHQ